MSIITDNYTINFSTGKDEAPVESMINNKEFQEMEAKGMTDIVCKQIDAQGHEKLKSTHYDEKSMILIFSKSEANRELKITINFDPRRKFFAAALALNLQNRYLILDE